MKTKTEQNFLAPCGRGNKGEGYKDSGIPWIGRIPGHWTVEKLKKLFSFGKGLNITKENLTETGIPVISYGQIHSKKNTGTHITDDLIKFVPEVYLENNPQSLVNKGDFIFADTSEDIEGAGNCVFIDKSMQLFAGYHSVILRNINSDFMLGRYLSYLFCTGQWRSQIRSRVYGIKVYSITQKILKELTVIIPPLSEQQSIAAYLDRKCSAIDRVIEAESRIIEKLKEYRQSLITETVTGRITPFPSPLVGEGNARKGEGNNAPSPLVGEGEAIGVEGNMKASGIPWIGRIPRHWGITQISRLFNVILGKMLSPKPLSEADTLENYLCSANIRFEGIDTKEIKQMYFTSKEKEEYLLKKGDVLISEGGDAGTVSIYNNEAYPCYIQNAVHKLFSKDDKKALNRFLYYWIFFCKKIGYIDFLCNKVSIMHYTKEKVLKTPIVVPPIEEQKSIADFLDKKCSAIDSTISKKQQVIEKMTEYKKSLIYECVTGKLSI